MTGFAELAALARTAIDAVHGEAATLKPTDRAKGPHGQRGASASRPETGLVACYFQDTEAAARLRAQPMLAMTGERLLHHSPEIFCSTGFAGEIAAGDRLLRVATGDLHEIVTIDADGIGNRILGLAAVKG